jgi:hypothetical protein
MSIEEMIIAHNALSSLDESDLNQLLDLIEGEDQGISAPVLVTLRKLQAELEAHFGRDHPTVLQLRFALPTPD